MKKRVVKDRILVLILSFLVIVLSLFLIVMLANDKKKKTCDNKENIPNTNEIVCGDDSDLSRFVCSRFRQNGFIVTLKETEDSKAHESLIKFMSSNNGMIAMLVDKREINSTLSNMYGLLEEKDFGINSFLFIPNNNVDEKKLNDYVSKNQDYDKVIKVILKKEEKIEKN